ncbi:hypothetical protein ACJX0J_009930, partial [Zea mays]
APPTNLSGSSSSSSVAPMPKRKNGAGSSRSSPHMWTDEEEWTLLAEIRELLKTQPLVIKKRVKFYESLAGMMNKKFAGKDGYVVLTASKIRTKLLHYKESFSTRAPMIADEKFCLSSQHTSSGTCIEDFGDVFDKLWSDLWSDTDNDGTSSGLYSGAA